MKGINASLECPEFFLRTNGRTSRTVGSGSFLSQLKGLRNSAMSQKPASSESTNSYIHCPQLSAADAAKRDILLADLVEKGDLTQAQADLIRSGVTPVSIDGPVLKRCGAEDSWGSQSGILDLQTFYQLLIDRIPAELEDSSAARGYKIFMDALDEMMGK